MTPDEKIHQALLLLAEAERELESEMRAAWRPITDARIATAKADRALRQLRKRDD